MATLGGSVRVAFASFHHTYWLPEYWLANPLTLFRLQNRLYNLLGAEKAPFAHAKMLAGGTVQWHNYADGCKGVVGMSI